MLIAVALTLLLQSASASEHDVLAKIAGGIDQGASRDPAEMLWTSKITISPIPSRQLTVTEREAFEAAVKTKMNDPDSAKFRWQPVSDDGFYCAEVNGKNRFGGYVGFEIFAIKYRRDAQRRPHIEEFSFVGEPSLGVRLAAVARRHCLSAGYALPEP